MKKTKLFHKILAFTLILSILFSMFVFGPVINVMADENNTNTEEIEYWSGEPATDFAGGSGTKADPYLIENGGQLYLMVSAYSNAGTAKGSENTKTYFKLRKDIYLNNVTDADLKNPTVESWNAKNFKNWFTLTGDSVGFCGDLDGDGHTVYGLYANGGFAGLIPLLADGGNVHNVNLKNSFIYGNTNGGAAGGIVGYVYSYWLLSPVTVSNCLVDNIVVNGGSARTGGIVGGFYNIKVTVTNCAVTNTKLKSHSESYPDYVSGIVGCNNSSESLVSVVTNCYTDDSVHPVNATSDKTNFDIIDDKVTYTNVYTSATKNFDADEGVTYLTEAEMQGEAATTNMRGFDFLYQWKVVADNYPVPNQLGVWDGTLATNYAGGSGTKADPYLIENGAQLLKMVKESTANGKDATTVTNEYFKITADIYLNPVSDQDMANPTVDSWSEKGYKIWDAGYRWAQNTGFCGNIDGDGHTIYGLYVDSGCYSGFLANVIGNATVTNLHFKNAFVRGASNGCSPAVIIGAVNGNSTVRSTATVTNSTVDNCYVLTDNASSYRHGIIVGGGFNEGQITVSNCAVTNCKGDAGSATPGRTTAFIGNTNYTKTHLIENCFTDSSLHPVTNATTEANYKVIHDNKIYKNVYTSAAQPSWDTNGDITYLTEDQMKGDNALTNMPGLDFEYVWVIVNNGYPIINPNPVEVWDGTTATKYAGGSGTKADPYLIENGAQLLKMVKESTANTSDASSVTNNYFKIVKDIYLNPVTAKDMVAPTVDAWTAKGYTIWDAGYRWAQNTGFCGNIDGDGHTIYGLYVESGCYSGFLANVVGNATVTNLHFKNAFVRGASNGCSPAVIIGAVNGNSTVRSTATVTNCTVDNGYVFSDHTGSWRNGIVVGGGINEGKITVSNCAVTNSRGVITNTSTEKRTAAFIGNTNYTKTHLIENCFTDSSMHPVTDATTEANYNTIHDNKNYVNVYTSAAQPSWDTNGDITYLTEDQMKGEAAKENMPGLDYDRYWKIVDNDYPETCVYNSPSDVWDGKAKASSLNEFNDGKGGGTAQNPYRIENAAQLAYVVTTDLEDGLYFELVNDIKINDTFGEKWKNYAHEWVQNTGIRAVLNLDGNGHTIDGLYFNSDKQRMGLFAYIGDSVVKNIKFTNASINHTSNKEGIAIVAGQTSATSTFETIYIDETCEINAPSATGVAAIAARGYTANGGTENAGANIRNCAVLADITGKSAVGTYAGTYWYSGAVVNISSCYSTTGLPVRGNFNGTTNVSNVYGLPMSESDTTSDNGRTIVLDSANLMKGEAARTNMPGLVFGAVWEIVKDDYPVIVKKPIESWDGKIADKFADGSGTAEDPFLIENGGQLYKMVKEYSNMNIARKPADQDNAQPHFRITKDINLGNNQWYTHSIWRDSMDHTAYASGFNGVIEGDGHTVYGLFVAGTDAYSSVGLIPVATQGAQIYNLHLSYGNLSQTNWNGRAVGAFIGLAKGIISSEPIVIDGCSVDNFVINSENGSAAFVAYTYSQSINIKNSYCINTTLVNTVADNDSNSGAFVAVANGNSQGNTITIENSYCDNVPSEIYFIKMSEVTKFNNVYTTYSDYAEGVIEVTDAQLQGANAKETLAGFNFNQVWACGSEGEYPVHKAYNSTIWNGREASAYAGGEGTAESPYEIATAEQLYKLANADTASTKGKYFKLTADITISDIYDGWTNDNPYTWAKKTAYLTGFTYGNSFAGTLDGDGHTVTGLYIAENITDGGTYTYGLIPFVSTSAVVKNINIDKVKIDVDGNAYVGAVVGAAYSKGNDATNPLANAQIVGADITNCDITSNSPSTTGDIFGGAVGGLKVELCNNEEKYDNVISYNAANLDDAAVLNIRGKLLGKNDDYITDINAKDGFNVCDLLSAKKSLLYKATEDNSDEYEVVWLQDFNGSEIDYSVWSRNTTMGTTNPDTKLTTIKYADVNKVENSTLTLSCNDSGETVSNGNSTYKVYNVNYGLDTGNSMSFKYGKLTMRAKIPFYRGAFPSLWLTSRGAMGNETITPYSTEIDIFEVFGNGQYDLSDSTWNHTQMVACIHKWYNNENGISLETDCSCGTSSSQGNNYIKEESERSTYISSADIDKWQIIEFEWDENKMTFSVRSEGSDKVIEYYSVTRAELEGKFGITGKDYSAEGIFDQFLSIRLNNHMYTPGGRYEYSSLTSIDESKLNYEIDYIKIEQKNDGKSAINLK